MNLNNTTDKEVLEAIIQGGSKRLLALKTLFESTRIQRTIFAYITQVGGTQDDLREVMQETIIIFDNVVKSGKFNQKSAIETFIVGIAKNVWRELLRKRGKYAFVDDLSKIQGADENSADINIIHEEEEQEKKQIQNLVQTVLGKLSEHCQNVLALYINKTKMKDIAIVKGYSGPDAEQQAKNAVMRCRKQMRAILESDQTSINLIKNWL